MRILKTAVLVAMSLLTGSGFAAGDDSKLVVVLDASNSMWGQIEGHHKIETARASLANLLETQAEQANITLLTYGSQRKSDCSDIKLASGSPAEILQQVADIKPKGRSPISAAITQAATAGHRILLISDGQESCGNDPCATTRELKARYPDLQIHVAGFPGDPDPQLQCIADNTDGKLVLASDTAALGALLSSPSPGSAEAGNNPPSATDTPGKLELTLGAGDDPANLQGSFLIYDANDEHINSFTARTEVSHTLLPGKYRVDVLWRQFKLSATLTVSPDQTTTYRFNMGGMGKLRLDAKDTAQQPVNVNFTLYTQESEYLSDHLLKSSINEQLPAGVYRIRADYGNQTQDATIEVTASSEVQYTFVFNPAN
ncbi:MAG: VWA domain-containing protein [Gammaproteobacteria bacterium]|nr:VWA domain-containing protein [Gammaproteobacteria bacterium]MBU1725290.1 VWA domain-containing protein [Gammaproteobacteria bacterium]MBU2006794.1 VWA domain-containing protein [Gammaproteobacteria bacterium]